MEGVSEPTSPWLLCYEVVLQSLPAWIGFLMLHSQRPSLKPLDNVGTPGLVGLTSSLISRRMEGCRGMALNSVPTTQHCSPGCSSHNFFTATRLPGHEGIESRTEDKGAPGGMRP